MADEAAKQLEAAEKAYAAAAEALPAKAAPAAAKPAAKAARAKAKPAAVAAAPDAAPQPVLAAEAPALPAEVAEPAAAPAAEPEPAAAPAPLKAEILKRAPLRRPAAAKKPAPAKARPIVKPQAAKTAVKPRKPAALPRTVKPAKATPYKALPKAPPAPKPIVALKEMIMSKTPDFTKSVSEAVTDLQSKAKVAYEKSTVMAGEATEFTKGNVEALVESGKIFSEGLQDLGKTYAEEAKSAFETVTADLKEMAAIKSPTELFQLQGKLARRNFDSLVAFSSKSSEALVKLASEGFAPISSRVSVAAEKITKVAA